MPFCKCGLFVPKGKTVCECGKEVAAGASAVAAPTSLAPAPSPAAPTQAGAASKPIALGHFSLPLSSYTHTHTHNNNNTTTTTTRRKNKTEAIYFQRTRSCTMRTARASVEAVGFSGGTISRHAAPKAVITPRVAEAEHEGKLVFGVRDQPSHRHLGLSQQPEKDAHTPPHTRTHTHTHTYIHTIIGGGGLVAIPHLSVRAHPLTRTTRQ
jgi:hypothetical protein